MDLNIYAFVGMIMLIGIVEKNAIMQIDFALEAERGGMSSEQAIYQGCLIRFRPIMMTTMAALLGAVPIALGYGAGGEARQPLGLVVVGGLLFSQLVTLYLTPVVLHLHGAGAGVAQGRLQPGSRRISGYQIRTGTGSGFRVLGSVLGAGFSSEFWELGSGCWVQRAGSGCSGSLSHASRRQLVVPAP